MLFAFATVVAAVVLNPKLFEIVEEAFELVSQGASLSLIFLACLPPFTQPMEFARKLLEPRFQCVDIFPEAASVRLVPFLATLGFVTLLALEELVPELLQRPSQRVDLSPEVVSGPARLVPIVAARRLPPLVEFVLQFIIFTFQIMDFLPERGFRRLVAIARPRPVEPFRQSLEISPERPQVVPGILFGPTFALLGHGRTTFPGSPKGLPK